MAENIKILVDADSCSFKEEIISLASLFNIELIFISSVSHYSNDKFKGKYIIVDNYSQAVDMAVINKLKAKDIVVTQDFGLAALVLGKGGLAISTRGKIYEEGKIEELMFKRHVEAKIRRGGGKTKGPSKITEVDRKRFKENLRKLILKALEG